MPDALSDALARQALRLLPPGRETTDADLDRLPPLVARRLRGRLRAEATGRLAEAAPWVSADPEAWAAAQSARARYPAEAWAPALRAACADVAEALVAPADVLPRLVVGEGEERPAPEAIAALRETGVYPYLAEIAARYAGKKGLASFSREALADLIGRIERRVADELDADGWVTLLGPLYDLAAFAPERRGAISGRLLASAFAARGAPGLGAAVVDRGAVTRDALRRVLAGALAPEPPAPPAPETAGTVTTGEPADPEPAAPEASGGEGTGAPEHTATPTSGEAGASGEAEEAGEPDPAPHAEDSPAHAPEASGDPEPDWDTETEPEAEPPVAPGEPDGETASEDAPDGDAPDGDAHDGDAHDEDRADEDRAEPGAPEAAAAATPPAPEDGGSRGDAQPHEPAGDGEASAEPQPDSAESEPAASETTASGGADPEPADVTAHVPEADGPAHEALTAPVPDDSATALFQPRPPAVHPLAEFFGGLASPDDAAPPGTPHAAAPAAPEATPAAAGEPLWKRLARERGADPDTVAPPTPTPLWERFASGGADPATSGATAAPEATEARVLGASADGRAVYVARLFGGDEADYRRVLGELDRCVSWTEASGVIAESVFRRHSVNPWSETAISFVDAAQRRYAPASGGDPGTREG